MSPLARKDSTLRFHKERMLCVLVYVQEHLDDPLGLPELARRAHLAPHHFHRVFRGMLGEPLMAHVRRLRLERAAGHLKNTPRPVIDIALEAGYESHEAFTRAFKAAFALAPSEFRRRRAAPGWLRAPSGVHYRAGAAPRDFRAVAPRLQSMQVTIESLAPVRVAFVRHVGPYSECGNAWERLCAWAGPEGLLGPGSRFLGVSYDDPEVTPADKLRYDACLPVDPTVRPAGDIGVQVLAGGDHARLTHAGPYEKLKDTYARLMGQWLPRSGRRLRNAPCIEVYLNSPENTAPADLLTDVHIPLEPR